MGQTLSSIPSRIRSKRRRQSKIPKCERGKKLPRIHEVRGHNGLSLFINPDSTSSRESRCKNQTNEAHRNLPLPDNSRKLIAQLNDQMAEPNPLKSLGQCQCCFSNDATVTCSSGHGLCVSCLERESEQQLAGNRQRITATDFLIRCPAVGCQVRLLEEVLEKGLPPFVYRQRVQSRKRLLSTELNNRCRVCGGKGTILRNIGKNYLCDVIVCCESGCSESCCAECGERTVLNHKCSDKSKYEAWLRLLNHSTPCPNCRTFIEKTGGCDHISCKCGTEFCYGCGMRQHVGQSFCRNALVRPIRVIYAKHSILSAIHAVIDLDILVLAFYVFVMFVTSVLTMMLLAVLEYYFYYFMSVDEHAASIWL